MNYTEIENILKRHEGFRSKPYRCTAGKLTIGYGTNLDNGITEKEAETLLHLRVTEIEDYLDSVYPWFSKLCEEHQGVLINMAYNLGLDGLAKFRNMLLAWEKNDFIQVAIEMKNSKWARQVGSRANELIKIVQTNI